MHNLYTRLIQKDLLSSREKTQHQLTIEKSNVERAQNSVDEMVSENEVLRRNIKRLRQLLEIKKSEAQARQKKQTNKDKGAERSSEVDSTSLKDIEGHSFASLSALGGAGYGSQRIDIKKVEMINQNVTQMMIAKTPLESMLLTIKAYKQAFKNIARITIFVINRYLQANVFKGMEEFKRNYRGIPMAGRNEVVYAIYDDPKECCKPQF